ncbi:heavy-metal-associated domain-containing protein [Algoriphagus sediminis]|uniref:Heavy metal-associated domain-containing protein n=1 Tax=Algoriphagus sediminis TaxID=3057113 RepID=A0ABT7YHF2_9BACT|nr:heavy metal-associated domain-containing protein [Algoriphagus sediminis]MDN3205903.1 heavy metal-associated domain-containing protein [Algoriphagus sediminis]
MKKVILTILIASFGFLAHAQIKTIGIKTSAVCEMCKNTLEKDLTFEKGVKSVNLDLETMVLNIAYLDSKTSPEILRQRIAKVGYNADSVMRDPKAYAKLDECCKDGAHSDEVDHSKHKKKKGDGN